MRRSTILAPAGVRRPLVVAEATIAGLPVAEATIEGYLVAEATIAGLLAAEVAMLSADGDPWQRAQLDCQFFSDRD